MFCSTCTPAPPPGPGDGFTPDATLVATSVGLEPIATLRTDRVSGNFAVGDAVPGVGTIATIGFTYVELVDADGRHGRVTLEGGGDAGRAATQPAAAATPEPWDGRLTKIDDHTFEVERSLVRELVSGAVRPGSARVIPIPGEHGQLAGLRLSGVRAGSLAAALGMRNGDTLTEINGAKIANANVLLDVLGKLDSLHVVEVDGTRGGKPLGITLRLK
jgi:membrane-associated protease RseP (regulator of RpoE activity)